MKFTIDIDCAPGGRRPDSYIGQVVEGLGLTVNKPISMFFGNWTWEFETTQEHYDQIRPLLASRIKALYNDGSIRYGSW